MAPSSSVSVPSAATSHYAHSAASSAACNGSASTSVHLKVNNRKGVVGGSNNQRDGAVSIQCNKTTGDYQLAGGNKKDQKPSTVISKANNITLKSKASNNSIGNKENTSSKDFPSLGQASKSLEDTFRSASAFPSASGSTSFNSKNTGAPNMASKLTSAKFNENKFIENAKKVTQDDFPLLASNSIVDHPMKNYHGVSKVTVPVNNSWTKTTEHVPKSQTATKAPPPPVDTSSVKNKKKKANLPASSATAFVPGTVVGSASNSGKKRPLRLGNVFEDSDDDVQSSALRNTYRLGEEALYTSVAPESTSNIRVMPAEAFQSRKKSELKIGALKAPEFKKGDFPSLGGMNIGGSKKNNNGEVLAESWTAAASGKKTNKAGQKSNFSNTDMTFHNSYGETFAISPSEESNSSLSNGKSLSKSQKSKKEKVVKQMYTFIHPPDFEKRNQQLIQTISELCEGNTDKFVQ